MRDVLDELLRRWSAGERVALATVIATWSSAPRQPGAAMLVAADGTVTGSVSGGCVEGAVYELCRETLSTGTTRTVSYGVTDDDAYEVGLPCGGTVEILVERVDRSSFPELADLAAAVSADRPIALATRLDGGGHRLTTGTATGVHEAEMIVAFTPPPRMLVFGGTDHAAAVVTVGAFLGYRVTVCDARPVFATPRRFPDAAEVITAWPHKYLAAEAAEGRTDDRTVVCVLTHDPKFDVPLLEVALRLPVGYVGAMGSRRTHRDRLARLRAAGLTEEELDRLASPIGLDLGARTPAETAISIAAEIVAARGGGSGARLTNTDGPIH